MKLAGGSRRHVIGDRMFNGYNPDSRMASYDDPRSRNGTAYVSLHYAELFAPDSK